MNLLVVAATEFEIKPFIQNNKNAEVLITGIGIPATFFISQNNWSKKNMVL